MTNKLAKLLLVAVAFSFTNCAAIIHGSKQDVIILSEPKKANVEIDGLNVGITPFVARLKRQNSHEVKITLNGYNSYKLTLNRKLDGWIFGNIIFGGIIGIAIDAAAGSMYKLTPKDVNAELKGNATTLNSKKKDGLYLAVVLKPNPSWIKIGELQKSIQ